MCGEKPLERGESVMVGAAREGPLGMDRLDSGFALKAAEHAGPRGGGQLALGFDDPANDAAKTGHERRRRSAGKIDPMSPPNAPTANTTLIHPGSDRYSAV